MNHPKSKIQDLRSPKALQFVLACCQAEPSDADIDLILSFLQDPAFNIQDLLSLSTYHGVLPLVYKTLKSVDEKMCEKENGKMREWVDKGKTHTNAYTHSPIAPFTILLPELQSRYQSIARRNMLMSAELLRIVKLLQENGIEALAFKGPVLSQMAYGDITLRQYGDLDVLVRKEDIYKVDKLLKQQGYQRLLELTPVQERTWIRFAHDLGFVHPVKGVHFEMHWSFLDEDYPMQVDLERFWNETQTVAINGRDIPTFSNENLLVYLSIHGSKHLWERIEWIVDLDRLIRSHEIDWEKVELKAKNTGFEKMIYLGLFLNHLLFDTPLPKNIHHAIAKIPVIQMAADFVLQSWDSPKTTFQKTSMMLRLFPGVKERLVYLHKIILKPSFNEYWAVDLPKGMYWGYYLVRPYLLIKKYFTKQ